MNSTISTGRAAPTPRGTMIRAITLTVAVVTVAGLVLGALGATLGTGRDAGAAPTATPAAAPTPAPTAAPAPDPAPVRPAPGPDGGGGGSTLAPTTHTVAAGETLSGVAGRYGVPVELLVADNALGDPDRLRTGQVLAVTAAPTNVVVIAPGATLSGYAQRYATTVDRLLALNRQIHDPDRILAGYGLRVTTG